MGHFLRVTFCTVSIFGSSWYGPSKFNWLLKLKGSESPHLNCPHLLYCLIFWCLIGEVFVFMRSSGRWRWPTPLYLDKVQSPDMTTTIPQIRTYYQDGSTHHYALSSYKRLSANGYFKIMFISDPHIMHVHTQ